jgi:RNA polymerase sigma factor (sigma-70 family)
MIPDCQLLRRYADDQDEAAFAELVRRHVELVYSVALRHAAGDAPLAQDVTQTVFTDLARKARFLSGRSTLAGWLHTSARFAANSAVRGERRRRAREQEAAATHESNPANIVNWEQLQPLLDDSVGRLNPADRDAILLRFFEGKSHREIGDLLGLSENVANKRIERALDKLRAHFARRGVTISAAFLATEMSAHSVQASPAGLAAQVSKTAVTGAGAVSGSIFFKILFMSTPMKIAFATVLLIIAALFTINWPRASQPSADAILLPRLANPTGSVVLTPVKPPGTPMAKPAIAPPVLANSSTTTITTPPAAFASPDTASSAPEIIAGPQADLATAISTGIHFLDAQDTLSFLKTLMPPDAVASEGQGSFEDVAAHISRDSRGAQQIAAMLEALKSLDDKTPSLNDDQTRATYLLDPPVAGHKAVIFNKINDFWYLDGM